MDMKELTDVQQRVLTAIRDYVQSNDCPPTVREIQKAASLSSPSHVNYHLGVLERKGFIHRTPDVSRGIEVMADTDARHRLWECRVPLVGSIAAGEPIAAFESPDPVILTPEIALGANFALRVRGDSMMEDHILNGDTVLVRSQSTADDGDRVVALLFNGVDPAVGEATLKRLYREKPTKPGERARIRLQPCNSSYQPIYVDPEQVQIRGKVVGLIRGLA
jgi:repressor LexA